MSSRLPGRFEGKVALVTGAARGQGRSHAIRLAEEGADIIAIDVARDIDSVTPFYPGANQEDLAESVDRVKALDRRILATTTDVRHRGALRTAVDDGVRRLGRLDVVLANAGIFALGASVEVTDTVWQEVIDVNLTGVWHTCAVAIPHLRTAGGGSIVITSSTAGLKGSANVAAYAASKHGVVGLMRSLANELAPDMIRVNTVHPGSVDTPMLDDRPLYTAPDDLRSSFRTGFSRATEFGHRHIGFRCALPTR